VMRWMHSAYRSRIETIPPNEHGEDGRPTFQFEGTSDRSYLACPASGRVSRWGPTSGASKS